VRLETFPLVLAVLVGLVGLALIVDAFVSDRGGPPLGERRRRARAERDRLGEVVVGLGTLCMAAALAGRDTWRYGNVAVIAGTILLLTGAALNHRFLRELLLFRGAARRQEEREPRGREVTRHMSEAARTEKPAAPATPAALGSVPDVAPAAETDAAGAPAAGSPPRPRIR
jgi:hypothetical protein